MMSAPGGGESANSAATEIIPSSIAKNLADRSYDKRKHAALELEVRIKELHEKQKIEEIKSIMLLLKVEYAESPNPNRRKGGLIGLAAAAIALHESTVAHLDAVLGPVLNALSDDDSRVRYYACEALYNITKVARGHILVSFNEIFRALCKLHADPEKDVRNGAQFLDRLVKDVVTESDEFDIDMFIPILREMILMEHPFIRQFVVGWITILDQVPDIDMLEYLSEFLGGLVDMLADNLKDIRQLTDSCIHDFLSEIEQRFKIGSDSSSATVKSLSMSVNLGAMMITLVSQAESIDKAPICRITSLNWIMKFIEIEKGWILLDEDLGLLAHFADMVRAVLTCISDRDEDIQRKAIQANESLLDLYDCIPLDSGKLTGILRRLMAFLLCHLPGPQSGTTVDIKSPTRTRTVVLTWITKLLIKSADSISDMLDSIFPALLTTLSDEDVAVASLDLEVLTRIMSLSEKHFQEVLVNLVQAFHLDRSLLDKRGSLIIKQLCVLLDAETIYRSCAKILSYHSDPEFVSLMVQTLNLILLTSSELFDLRDYLKRSLDHESGRELFDALYQAWCFNPIAALSLCLLAQAYELGSALVFQL